MVVSAVTRLPGATLRSDARPVSGAVTRVKPRLRAAVRAVAWAAITSACAVPTVAWRVCRSCWLVAWAA